jgi:glutathione S-transferase
MLLIGQCDSPYVRRVAVSLHLLGLPFERSPLSVFGDFDAMRRLNPLGRVPALVLDPPAPPRGPEGGLGEVLVDSGAILDHLDELAGPGRALLPPSGPLRRQALQVMALATGASDKAAGIVYERARRTPAEVDEAWLGRLRLQLEGALAALERRRPDPWFLGERFGQADVTVATMVAYLRLALPELVAPGRVPALARHADACERLPAFEATRPGPDERPPEPRRAGA